MFWRFLSVADQIEKLVFFFFQGEIWELLKVSAKFSISLMRSFFKMRAKLMGKSLPARKTTVL